MTLIEDTSPGMGIGARGNLKAVPCRKPQLRREGEIWPNGITSRHRAAVSSPATPFSTKGGTTLHKEAAIEFFQAMDHSHGVGSKILTGRHEAHRSQAFIDQMAAMIPLGASGNEPRCRQRGAYLASEEGFTDGHDDRRRWRSDFGRTISASIPTLKSGKAVVNAAGAGSGGGE